MIGLAHFLEAKTRVGTRLYAWQNHWHGETVDQHGFYPFSLGEIRTTVDGADAAVQVSLPLNAETLHLADSGIREQHMMVLNSYKYDPSTPLVRVRVAGYYGQIVDATVNEQVVVLSVGSAVDAIEAQVPPRLFTKTLIGELPKL